MEIGTQILVDGSSPATIRYLGSIENRPGQWVGVEWWHEQGKHDGTLNGRTYFRTRKPRGGSFLRPERIHRGYSFTEALQRQYVKSFVAAGDQTDIIYSLFGKHYEDYVLDLSSIARVDLSSQWVNGFDDDHVTSLLPAMIELNIRQNLLRSWSQLWPILDQFSSQLETFNVSNSRMNVVASPFTPLTNITQLVLIDTDNDCEQFEVLLASFPHTEYLHLDLNRLTSISEELVVHMQHVTTLALSDNPTLKQWDPFINRLGTLPHLQELILNNCAIEQIKFPSTDQSDGFFPSLKGLYLSDNVLSSYSSIDQLSCLPSLISLSVLRNPIYPNDPIEAETAKQLVIARLPRLTHLNRVRISPEERRGAQIDYLKRYAQDYFENKLDFINEHRQYLNLIKIHGEPDKPTSTETISSKKGLCIRSDLLTLSFELAGDEKKLQKKVPSSMTVAKLKALVRRLFPSRLSSDSEIRLFVFTNDKHRELMVHDYQEINFYLANDDACVHPSKDIPTIRIEPI